MALFAAIVCNAFFLLVLSDFSQRLPGGQQKKFRRWFIGWALKGLLVPTLLWALFDGGIFDCFPTFSPGVEFAILAGHGFAAFCDVLTAGLFIVGSFWAAVTSAWLLTALQQQTEHPREFKRCVIIWSAILCPLAVLMTLSFGWAFVGVAATLWLLPIVQHTLSLKPEEQTVRPIYSQAIAKLHSDKHAEAEAAVLEILEKHENDFDGWLLLAELYANHFQDLPGAEDIIRQTCDHPDTTPSQAGVALHCLADWHLKVGNDPVAARRALWEICRRHPKSHLDRMARLRIEQIPLSKDEFIASQGPRTIPLPARAEQPGVASAPAAAAMSREEALAQAKTCVNRLKKSPDDIAAREALARLLVEQLDSFDQGLEQLELLLTMPNAPERRAAQWLALMALWKLNYKQDEPGARKLLERLVQLYPKTPQAFAAQSWLNLMDAETRVRAASSYKAAPPQV